MSNILYKELKLSTPLMTYFFLAFGLMFFIPGYPILCGVFFVTLGIFKAFESIGETNDIIFSSLLPIAKKDIVKGKFLLVCFLEICSLIIMGVVTIVRNTALINSPIYRENFMMNANGFSLGMACVMFSIFNLIFVFGFFKTTYKRNKPFILYIIVSFILIGIAESLHHFKGLELLNAFGSEYILIQLLLLLVGMIIYVLITFIAYRKSCQRFEKIDL